MFKRVLAVLCLMFSFGLLHAQQAPYRVVFDLTSPDSLNQQAVMRWVKEISSGNPNAEVEVVMYGKGFQMLMPEKSSVIEAVKAVIKNPKVSFKACQVALRNNKVDVSQLVEGSQTVPDGIYEIVQKQHDGWAYIKVAR